MHRLIANYLNRFVAILALAGFVAGEIGVSMPRLARSKDVSKPFPCQDHACGCSSAEQCWRSCCCFSNREKLVWAEEYHVTPPAYVLVAAARETKKKEGPTNCCAAKLATADRDHEDDCHDHESRSPCKSHSHEPDHNPEEKIVSTQIVIDFVNAVQARRCQGQAQLWLSLGAVSAPPAKVELTLEEKVCGTIESGPQSLQSISQHPATPPPRG